MIYLVEDDDNIRKLVCYALSKEGFEIQGYASPNEFWKGMDAGLPELILLDIMLPEEDGLSILNQLKSDAGTAYIPVIMLTAKGSEFDKVTGLDMGADDYVAKPFGTMELIARVRAVLRRFERAQDKRVYEIGGLHVDPAKHIITVSGKAVSLSYKEYLLLLELLEAEGDVVGRDRLLTSVWGEYYTESRTLDVHIRKLRVKLGDAGKLIQTVKGIGYKLGGGTDA